MQMIPVRLWRIDRIKQTLVFDLLSLDALYLKKKKAL